MPKVLLLKFQHHNKNQTFEIDEIEENVFMLTTKNQTITLFNHLKSWISDFSTASEEDYTKLLQKRSHDKLSLNNSLSSLDSKEIKSPENS